ncbi:MAG: SDR family oxidoreductase [candidate division Zixibacteria bacterium]|nr:SDR family oxidoreductase [candidate division Zixibacteria bacterium]
MSEQPDNDKVALLTGGSRGIGRAIALRLVHDGINNIIINYVQDDDAAKVTTDKIHSIGGRCLTVRANLAYPQEIVELFSRIRESYDCLDILVHCAAFGAFKPLHKIKPNQWDMSMDINTRAFLLCVQHSMELMKKGVVVAVSSLGSKRAVPNYGAIGVSKAALEAVIRQLAMELAPRGIRINGVAGGFIETDSIKHFPGYEELIAKVVESTPAGRLGQPEDIADVVSLLVADRAGWMHGQTVIADGGFSLL